MRRVPNSLGYEPETDEEYTKRLEDIVYSWHETHTNMVYKLKQLLKKEVFETERAHDYEHLMTVFNRIAEIIEY